MPNLREYRLHGSYGVWIDPTFSKKVISTIFVGGGMEKIQGKSDPPLWLSIACAFGETASDAGNRPEPSRSLSY